VELNPTEPQLNSLGGVHPKLKLNEVSSIGALVGAGFQLCRLLICTHMLHTLGLFKEVAKMSKVNKDLDNMARVEPRSYKKFSSIIMTKEMIACLLYYR
jgi:hypothetical protein